MVEYVIFFLWGTCGRICNSVAHVVKLVGGWRFSCTKDVIKPTWFPIKKMCTSFKEEKNLAQTSMKSPLHFYRNELK